VDNDTTERFENMTENVTEQITGVREDLDRVSHNASTENVWPM